MTIKGRNISTYISLEVGSWYELKHGILFRIDEIMFEVFGIFLAVVVETQLALAKTVVMATVDIQSLIHF